MAQDTLRKSIRKAQNTQSLDVTRLGGSDGCASSGAHGLGAGPDGLFSEDPANAENRS